MRYVDLAFHAVALDPSRLILLGMTPNEPEPEYGYILPDGELDGLGSLGFHKVKSFIEKPEPQVARAIISQGALWNTMVMVFRTKTFLDLARPVAPRLLRFFQQIGTAIGTPRERDVVEESYRLMDSMNLSKILLEPLALQHPSPLSVLPVQGVYWSDWGSQRRITSNLQKAGRLARSYEMCVPFSQGSL
jgi:mannose-1-phosphate guanylyltransferase